MVYYIKIKGIFTTSCIEKYHFYQLTKDNGVMATSLLRVRDILLNNVIVGDLYCKKSLRLQESNVFVSRYDIYAEELMLPVVTILN